MKIASHSTRTPHLVRALDALAQRAHHGQVTETLAHELSGITVLVARKFTNDRTADGLLEAFYLTTGCVSLGLALADIPHESGAELSFLLQHGAEQIFQMGFRHIKALSTLPCYTVISDFDNDPYVQQRNIKALFYELCRIEPDSNWIGDEDYKRQLSIRRENQKIVECAKWLRKHHCKGRIVDADLDASAVISIAVIFAIMGDGRIMARTGHKDIENLITSARKTPPDIEASWLALLKKIPPEYHAILSARIDEYRDTIIKKILSKTAVKAVIKAIQQGYAGVEQDVDYD